MSVYPNCGTYAGWNVHQKMGTETCDACKRANREYHRAYRRSNPSTRDYDRDQRAAYQAAQRRLRERHREEFDALYAEEKAAAGLGREVDA